MAFDNDAPTPLIRNADRKFEKQLYYRHPKTWSPGTPQEKTNSRADWIVWAGNNRDRMADLMERGFKPLRQFGICARYAIDQSEAQGTPDQYGPWGAILMHPEGPAAFPVDQVKTYRWYDPRHCPVPGVVFPQLDGAEIAEYACPDCNDRIFAQALHLSRHLRAQHEWTVNDVVEFGKAMGLDFSREFAKTAKTVRQYSAANDQRPVTQSSQSRVIAPVVIERVIPTRSEAPESETTDVVVAKNPAKGWTPERRAEASRKAKERAAK